MVRRLAGAAGAIGILLGVTAGANPRGQSTSSAEFVGTSPCGADLRAFVGGLTSGARCHAITWRLTLTTGGRGPATWRATAVYGIPPASNPNAMIDGPKVALDGQLQVSKGTKTHRSAPVYRLTADKPQRSLSFVRVAGSLLHLLTNDNQLMVGTAGWSYTLSPLEQAEKPGNPSLAPDMSYTISPRATGSTVFGLFEGRTPCQGIARELRLTEVSGCLKVKWRVTLHQNAQTAQPTTYKVESSLHRQQARQGNWRIIRGTAGDPSAIVYQLAATPAENAMLLLKGDDNVLYFLDQNRRALIGSVDFSYTLNRVGAP